MLKDRIENAVKKAIKEKGFCNQMVCVSLDITDEEKQELNNLKLDSHYGWNLFGDKLEITYLEVLIGE